METLVGKLSEMRMSRLDTHICKVSLENIFSKSPSREVLRRSQLKRHCIITLKVLVFRFKINTSLRC